MQVEAAYRSEPDTNVFNLGNPVKTFPYFNFALCPVPLPRNSLRLKVAID